MSDTTLRAIVWIVLLVAVAYDIVAYLTGLPMETTVLREINLATGSLFKYALLAIWCHLYLNPWGQ